MKTIMNFLSGFLVLLAATGSFSVIEAQALPKLVNCLSDNGSISVRAKKCAKKETLVNLSVLQAAGPAGPAGTTGPQGPGGAAGADGKFAVYGDGSAGDFTATEAGVPVLDSANLQYNNFTVPAGKAIQIPSGAIIRCRGTFTNNGQISIQDGSVSSALPASPGLSRGPPTTPNYFGRSAYTGGGEIGSVPGASVVGLGGPEGRGIRINTGAQAKMVLRAHILGGGAGGNSVQGGGNGGGFITILASGAIINTGNIFVNGGDSFGGGSGGGAGGILVFASATSINNSGNIGAEGGDGSNASTTGSSTQPTGFGAGGGGSGGIVHFISPSNTINGSVSVAHGVAGTIISPITFFSATTMSVYGGGGGGACYGSGGNGGDVTANPNSTASLRTFSFSAATDGEDGIILNTVANPTSLF